MTNKLLAVGWLCLLPIVAIAQDPAAQLHKPPPQSRHYVVESIAGKHGDSWYWVAADGSRMGRESIAMRGLEGDVDFSGKAGADQMPSNLTIRGRTSTGDAAESFSVTAGAAQWHSPEDAGHAPYAAPAFYLPTGGPIGIRAWLLERLLASPDRTLSLLPGGKAHAAQLTTLEVGGGAVAKQLITLWEVTGISNSPLPMWSDSQNHFFSYTNGLGWLPEEYAGEQARMATAQATAMATRTAELAKSLVTMPAGPVAFVHVRLFDADAIRFLTDQTVVIEGGLITAVGAADKVTVPAGAQVIKGRGMTLVPGMWDCHMHVGDDYTGLQELSLGVTSLRDPGNNDTLTVDRRDRAAAGRLLFPHVYASSLIDGKGPYTAQVANVATSQAEAIAWVDKAKANGLTGVKFYGTLDAAWLPAAIAEAHRLGLHVHGHIPVGIRPMQAIDDGYDEVTHINWVIMQAMPDSVIKVSNSLMRIEGPGRYGKDVDLDSAPIRTIVETMAKRKIYSDPTMVAFEGLYVPNMGDMSPAYAPFVGTLPPATERDFRSGGLALPKDLTRATYRASFAKMIALLKRMHKAGVPIVAGTDGTGIEIVRELELYTQAGFTPAEALATATIAPARLVGADQRTGSIRVGKAADLVLVQGDPAKRIGDLRQTRLVMIDGRMLDADALRSAAGYSGRPK